MCTGTPGTARNRVKDVSRAAENSAFKELSVKFLELKDFKPYKFTQLFEGFAVIAHIRKRSRPSCAEIRTCTPCTRSPMSTQAPGERPERAAERNRILEFSSKMTFNTLKY